MVFYPNTISALLGSLVAMLFLLAPTARAVEIGEKAPNFSLPSTTGQKISLEQFRGKKLVLLEFYIADFGAT